MHKKRFPKRQAELKRILTRRKNEVFGVIPEPRNVKDHFKENFDEMVDILSKNKKGYS